MNSTQAFPSNYLKSDDVSGNGETYTMGKISMVEFTDPQTQEVTTKPVLGFANHDKSLILNKTNWKRIAKMHGDDSETWLGKQIMLRLESVEAFGKTSDVIRVAN